MPHQRGCLLAADRTWLQLKFLGALHHGTIMEIEASVC